MGRHSDFMRAKAGKVSRRGWLGPGGCMGWLAGAVAAWAVFSMMWHATHEGTPAERIVREQGERGDYLRVLTDNLTERGGSVVTRGGVMTIGLPASDPLLRDRFSARELARAAAANSGLTVRITSPAGQVIAESD